MGFLVALFLFSFEILFAYISIFHLVIFPIVVGIFIARDEAIKDEVRKLKEEIEKRNASNRIED